MSTASYRPYTTAHDTIVRPDHLYDFITPDSRFPRNQFFEKYKDQVSKWYEGKTQWLLDFHNEFSTVASRWAAPETLVTILVDLSGSLQGEKQIISHLLVSELDRALLKSDVAFEVLGFTTCSWHGGNSRRDWHVQGAPVRPGRLCDLLHIIFRDWGDETATETRYDVMLDPRILKENIDGEAIDWARSRFEHSPYEKHLLIAISDGAPVDDSTLLENHEDILWDHWWSKIDAYERSHDKGLIGIGIGYDIQDYIGRASRIDKIEQVPKTLENIVRLLDMVLNSSLA